MSPDRNLAKILGESVVPDQILTESELILQEERAEKGEGPFPTNWPPKRRAIHTLTRLVRGISFVIKHPGYYRVLRSIQRQRYDRDLP